MFCKNCGAECAKGEQFCHQCGSKLEIGEENIQKNEPGNMPANQKSSGSRTIVLACVLTLLVACTGFACVYYFILRNDNSMMADKNNMDMQSGINATLASDKSQTAQPDLATADSEATTAEPEITVPKEQVNIDITAVDTVDFPKVTLYFSVKDLKGKYIDTINAFGLSIFERKSESNQDWQKVASSLNFHDKQKDRKKSVAFVMDISGSMDGYLETECDAARYLIGRMQQDGNYSVALTAFSDTQHDWKNYTEDFSDFKNYLSELEADGGTAFYDTLKNTLNHALYETGQKYILAFTDGEDNESYTEYSEIVNMAESYKIPIYIITTLESSGYVSDVEEIAELSGGGLYTIDSIEDLQGIYDEVFELQKEQFSLTYETTQKNDLSDVKLEFLNEIYEGSGEESYYARKPEQYYEKPEIKNVTASSELGNMTDSKGKLCTYKAGNVWDGDNRTAWVEGKNGDGIGESLWIELKNESMVNGIEISNGYYKNKEVYYRNNRVKKMKLTFSDGSSKIYELEDDFQCPSDIVFDEPVVTSAITLEVLSVYKSKSVNGKKACDDTCITELEVY